MRNALFSWITCKLQLFFLYLPNKKSNGMKTSINTIKYLFLLAVVFLLLTYSISHNEENKWLVINTPWISNSFAFTIAGGTFASLVVILACEIQKYYLMKRQMEDYLYSQLFALYTQITIIHYNTKRQINEQNSPVPRNLIDEIANRGLVCLNNLASTDYLTFGNCSITEKLLIQYKGENGMCIRSFLHNTVFLKMAINEDKIDNLKQGRDEMVKSISPKANLVLQKIYKDSSVVLTFIEESLDSIDLECKNRYHWKEMKRSVISSEENFNSADLDSFLELPVIKFD